MKSTIEQVKQFHDFYGVKSDEKNQSNRVALIQEELDELREAILQNNLVEILDALTDLQYFIDGTYIVFGLERVKDAAFQEVHRSNMSKAGLDGKPILRDDGKILKGPNYFKPNLVQFLQNNHE